MASKLNLKTNYSVTAKCDAYFTGHHIEVTSDGKQLLCECGDNIGVVSVETGLVSGRITCDEDQITCLSLSPDNTVLVAALKSTSVRHYDWPSQKLVRSFKSYHRGPVATMAWDASSTLLITGGADSVARIWDIKKKYCTHSLKGAQGVFGYVLFDSDLMVRPWVYAAVGSAIVVWKLGSGYSEVVATLKDHHSTVTQLQLTPDGSKLVSCGHDRVIILWNLETLKNIKVLPVYESLSAFILMPHGVNFKGAEDHDHIYAMVVGDRGTPSVWQVEAGREVWKASEPLVTLPDQEGTVIINQMMFVHSINSVIFAAYDHSILFAKPDTMTVWKQLAGYNEQIVDAVFVGQNDSHLVVAASSIQLRIYDCKTLSCFLLKGHTAITLCLCRHPTVHKIFASSSHDNSIRVWQLQENGCAVCVALAVGHTQSIGCIAMNQETLTSGSKDLCIKFWKLRKQLVADASSEPSTEISQLHSKHTEKAHEKDINSMCLSLNGRLLATGSQDKTAKIWDVKTFSLQGVLRGHRRGIWCVQFSPVDEVLATASADATIKIWTLSDFTNALTLDGHNMSVLKLQWVSHGQQLLSVASDGLMKLWNVRSGLCVGTYDEHQDRTWALAVSQDEQQIVTGGEDAALVWWKDVTEEEKAKAVAEAEKLASQEQTLLNLIQGKKWAKALHIAIRLNHPFRALNIIKALLDESPDELSTVLKKLREDQVSALLRFTIQWNTKTKNAREAQSIVNILMKEWLPEELEALPEWQEALEGLLPYTERHFHRLSALYQSSAIVSYLNTLLSHGLSDISSHGLALETDDLPLVEKLKSEDLYGYRSSISDEVKCESNTKQENEIKMESKSDTEQEYEIKSEGDSDFVDKEISKISVLESKNISADRTQNASDSGAGSYAFDDNDNELRVVKKLHHSKVKKKSKKARGSLVQRETVTSLDDTLGNYEVEDIVVTSSDDDR